MQFLDIYQQDELFLRIPLGETDLMESSTHCEQDVVFRQRIVKVMIRRIKRSVESIGIKRAEYYLVFESKMNLVEDAISI